ncbi:hypothetical protein [Streptomyces sp. MK7]|uniref:hypothetical protein n=1 Tax=Streptomyces sp. MK7 TaxID=3067635 RepID=UPI00292F9326|nr:hypothetical protein [Streptomyces sp. MK7]
MNVQVRAAADLRMLRAAVFSAVCVALPAGGHMLASGTGVRLWSLAAGWAAVLCLVGPLAGRERSLSGIVLALLVAEFGLHLLFSLGQGSTTSVPADRSSRVGALAERFLCGADAAHLTPDSAARILRQAHIDPGRALPVVHGTPGTAGMAGHGGHAMMLSSMFTAPMLAAHLAAAVVTGWVLRRCEVALWRVIRLQMPAADQLARLALLWWLSGLLTMTRVLVRVVALLEQLLRALLPRRTEDDGAQQPQCTVLWTCVVRRGPPAVAVAA